MMTPKPDYIRKFLDHREFEPDPEGDDEPWVFVETDPIYRVAHVVGEEGDPARLQSITKVKVPMHFWLEAEENDIIFRVMNEAAKDNLRRVRNYGDITPALFAKAAFNLKVLVANPEAEGRFPIPPRTTVFYSKEVPLNRLIGLGPPNLAGLYLTRGEAHGFIANKPKGLQSILIFDTR